MEEKIAEQKNILFQMVGRKFNPSSNDELGKVLFKDLGLPPQKFNAKSGNPSVDAETLKILYELNPDLNALNALILLRKFEKVLSTYFRSWMKRTEYDGRLHASFNQTGTATHRLSSSKPNLQNVPMYLKEADLNIKSLFVTDDQDKYDFFDLDIANAEMRVLCAYSKDETLIQAFKNGMDLHCLTGSNISDFTYEQLMEKKEDKSSKEYIARQVAKKVSS